MPTERVEAFFDHLVQTEAFINGQLRWWVWDAQDVAGRLANNVANTPELRAAFWLRLGGVLIDIDDRLGRLAWDERLGEFPQLGQGFRADAREHAVEALEVLRDVFPFEELVFIEFQRNSHAHPFLGSYRLKLNQHANWKWLHSKCARACVELSKVNESINTIVSRYQDFDRDCAVDFARRCWLPLSNVHLAIIPLTV